MAENLFMPKFKFFKKKKKRKIAEIGFEKLGKQRIFLGWIYCSAKYLLRYVGDDIFYRLNKFKNQDWN